MSCATIATHTAAVVRSSATSTPRRGSGACNNLNNNNRSSHPVQASARRALPHALPRRSHRRAVAVTTTAASAPVPEELPPDDWAKEWRASLTTDELQEFMKEACKRLDSVDARFICIGDGGILESVNPFPSEPRFAELGPKGTCCTLASPNKNFEAHLFLAKVKEVVLARSERGDRKIYAMRFFGDEAASKEAGAPPPRPMLTVVLHGGEDGAVPKAAVDMWESLAEFLR